MIKIKIDNETFEILPLTVDVWLDCMKWDIMEKVNWAKIISIATGAPLADMRLASYEEQQIVVTMIAQEYTRRQECRMKDLTTITFGEWIDLEIYLNDGIAVSLPKIMKKLDINTDLASRALWGVDKYIEFRDLIYRQYSGLFGLNEPQDEYDDEEEAPKFDRDNIARSWYNILLDLSDWDLMKTDQITEQPLKKVLNFMAAKKQRAIEERNQQLKKKREYELQRNRR